MKNKFLLFSLLLFAVGLVFLIFPATSLAGITTVTTGAATSTSKTGAILKGTIDIFGGSELYDRRGFNLGTVTSATGGNYNMGSSTVSGEWAGDGDFYHTTTTLPSEGETYYFRAYAASSTVPQLRYGSELKFITGIDDPASLAKTAVSRTSIDLSWTAATGAHTVNTYLRYRTDQYPTSITDGTSGCITSGSSCSPSSLSCGTDYYFRAWSSTTDGGLSTTSDSYAQLTDSTSICSSGGGRTLRAPTIYPDSLVINEGAKSTETREVELSLKADEALYMTISNDTLFLNPLEAYSATKKWTLTEGDGMKTIYVKFLSSDGLNSDIVSDTITLKTVIEEVPPLAPVEEAAPVAEAAPVGKPISEMTVDEIQAKIAKIMAQIQTLQAELTEIEKVFTFEVNLGYGNRGNDVIKLQEILIGEGLLGEGLNTGWFGPLTKAAVVKFQEKYVSEILAPLGLAEGTGFVGSGTRAKLDELSGK